MKQFNEKTGIAKKEPRELSGYDEEQAMLLLKAGLKKIKKSSSDIENDLKSAEWKLALGWWLKRQSAVKNRWLSESLNMGDISNLSKQIAKYGRERVLKCPWRKRIAPRYQA